ncbi:hemerythrin domain-containing protein [Polaromonas hydrogenivorans]
MTAANPSARPAIRQVALPGHRAPGAGLEAPFEMLAACHERALRMLALQAKLQQYLLDKGCDEPARQAARDVMRYFDLAAPLHHQDEELHVFPSLLAGPDAALRELARRLAQDHRQMEVAWTEARRTLQAIADSPESGWTPLTPAQSAALAQFAALYRRHLDDENTIAYPAAQAALPPTAVEAMSRDMMQRRGVAPKIQEPQAGAVLKAKYSP